MSFELTPAAPKVVKKKPRKGKADDSAPAPNTDEA
jgi:ATP-dependent Clp protease ATP-binding subunit ClpA